MRKHQRLNSYHMELASAAATRKAQAAPTTVTMAQQFWAEYYRLSSARVTDKTPRFDDAIAAYLCYRLAMSEDSLNEMVATMLAEGVTHRHAFGEYVNSILSGGIKVTA